VLLFAYGEAAVLKSTHILCFLLVAGSSAAGCEDRSESACNKGVYTGHVTISDKSEPADFEGYTQVTGNLTISCPNCNTIEELGCLTSVGGDLSVSGNGALETLDMANLIFVGGSFNLYQNPVLAAFEAGRLKAVGSWLTIRQNGALADFAASELRQLDGDVTVVGNASLAALELGEAGQIPGNLTVSDNAALELLETPGLVVIATDLTIDGNPALADLAGLDSLVSVGGAIDISHNGALPFCEVCDLLDQLTGFAGELTSTANQVDECWSGSALDCPMPSGDGDILGFDH
jgi:hypothetical protein